MVKTVINENGTAKELSDRFAADIKKRTVRDVAVGIQTPREDVGALTQSIGQLKNAHEQITRQRGDRGKSALLVEEVENLLGIVLPFLDERYGQQVVEEGEPFREVDDSQTSATTTWSSSKLSGLFDTVNSAIAAVRASVEQLIEWTALHVSTPDAHHARMVFKANYVPYSYQQKGDVVVDFPWTMHANKNTFERAGPIPMGEPVYLYDGTEPTVSVSAKQVTCGIQYIPRESGAWLSGYLIRARAGFTYIIYTWEGSDFSDLVNFNQIASFVAQADGPIEVNLAPAILRTNRAINYAAVIYEPDPAPSTFTGDWTYNTPQNRTEPLPGECIHSGKEMDSILFHKIDDAGSDRGAEMLAMTLGDLVSCVDVNWVVQAVLDQTDYVEFLVVPARQCSGTGLETFTFRTETASPITYLKDVDYFIDSQAIEGDTIRGFEVIDAPLSDAVADSNAYVMDLKIQPASIPLDWDFVGYSSP